MTGEPKAPGAPAVILYRQVDRDDSSVRTPHEYNYVREKIFTEEGRKYANVEIPLVMLAPNGTLSGDFVEQRNGDYGTEQRASLKSVTKDADRVKFIETMLSHSLSAFQLTKASFSNLNQLDQPFGYQYSLVAQNYAKTAGNLLLVRPRVLGSNSSDLLEKKEPRMYPVEFDGPMKNTDTIEIALPAGYEVDDLPPPVNADYSFASYHSKTEVNGNTLKYTRTFEVKELSVPLAKVEDLKKLYRVIAGDERNTAVLKPAAH